MSKVTMIPAKVTIAKLKNDPIYKKRVAAYARVSTGSDEQFTSFEAQKDYYTKYILSNPQWTFVDIYADEGISGTNTKNREGFNRMIADALDGKIDLIVTKSVSRFARNTVDSLSTIRKLKEKGVEVFFEKENIHSLDSKGELLLTIMSSLAQEESRSISQNVTWGKRKSFSDGKVQLPYNRFLGYKKGKDGRPEVIPEEAEIVKLIFRLFFEGLSLKQITIYLQEHGIKTKSNGTKWSHSTIQSILTNEKYKGEAILQKSFTTDFLTHQKKKNEGEVAQYHVQNSHEAIIPPEEWDLIQLEVERRMKFGKSYSCNSVFSNRIYCQDCGSLFGVKVWHSNSKYRTEVWQCNSKFKNEKICKTPHLKEEQIKAAFIKAYNILGEKKNAVLEDCDFIIKELTNTESLDNEFMSLDEEIEVINGLVEKLIEINASIPQDQKEYQKKYESLEKRYNKARERRIELMSLKERKAAQAKAIMLFMEGYRKEPTVLKEWNNRLWMLMVDKVEVTTEKKLIFYFNSGTKIEVELK